MIKRYKGLYKFIPKAKELKNTRIKAEKGKDIITERMYEHTPKES